MRVTAETKEATRRAILDVTLELLRERGWENVNTRDIAAAAEIANGTLFNYFPNKEAIAGAIVASQWGTGALAGVAPARRRRPIENDETVEEALFSLIASGLRRLRPLRRVLPARAHDSDERIRHEHLAEVETITGELDAVQRHLYWTLFSGVLAFWAADDSPKQEQTLALLDQSVALFAASLERKDRHERRSATTARRDSVRRRS